MRLALGLHAMGVAAALVATGCCDPTRPHLSSVYATSDQGQLVGEAIRWDGTEQELPVDGYFSAYRRGSPSPGLLRTIPMLQLYAEDGSAVPLLRYTASNEGGCAAAELYEPEAGAVVVGGHYRLVHPSSAAPGDLDDSGEPMGALADRIVAYDGEYALVADIVVVEPEAPVGHGGQGGGGGQGAGGQGVGGAGGG